MNINMVFLYIAFILIILESILLYFSKKLKNGMIWENILLFMTSLLVFIPFTNFLLNLINLDYTYQYVRDFSSNDMDIFLRIAASWSGTAGSFFFWLILLFSCYLLFRILFRRHEKDEIYVVASIIQSLNILAFIVFVILKDPFARNFGTISDGFGLNPLLSNFYNLLHPPIMFIAYSILAVSFSIALAKIITNSDDTKIKADLQHFLRFSMASGWLILGTGILIGGYWAYITLGWGGFWAWDPVETSSLVPWLFALVYFHGSPVFRKQQGSLGRDVVATLPYITIILSTIITRTGLINSVHAFGLSPSDFILLWFIGIMILVELIYVFKREKNIKFFFSFEEFSQLDRNKQGLYISYLAFILGTFAIILGLILPLLFALLPEPFTQTISVDPKYFNIVIGIFGLLALEAAFFTNFIFIKTTKNIFKVIALGMILGILNVIIGLPIVNYSFTQLGLSWFYSIIAIFSTTSLLANFIIPILGITLICVVITIYKFMTNKEMQKPVRMRNVSQSILHVGIIIALLGALISTNTTQIQSVSVSGENTGTLFSGKNKIDLKVVEQNVEEDNLLFKRKINSVVELYENGQLIGSGQLDYTMFYRFGLVLNVLIFPTAFHDYYLTILDTQISDIDGSVTSIRYQVRVIPMILPLWVGSSIVLISMIVLTVMTGKLWLYSYRKYSIASLVHLDSTSAQRNINPGQAHKN